MNDIPTILKLHHTITGKPICIGNAVFRPYYYCKVFSWLRKLGY